MSDIDYSTIFQSNDEYFVHYETVSYAYTRGRVVLERIVRKNAPLNAPVVWRGVVLDIDPNQLPDIIEKLAGAAVNASYDKGFDTAD